MDISLSNAIIAETQQQGGLPQENLAAAAERVVQPLLGGENVRVSAALTGDLQKLLAQVRNEQEEKKFQLAQRQLSAVLGQLCAMSDLTDAQRLQVGELQVKIEGLEAAIAREATTLDDRKKALETKRKLEAEERDEQEIAELEQEIAGLETKIAAQKKEVEGYSHDLTDLLAKLDSPALVLVLAAITVSAADTVTADNAPGTDEVEDEQKIPSPLEIMRDALEKAVEDIREEIVEKRIETV